jgi:hypothetical protein
VEATTRGFTASLVLIDEAAKVSEQLYRSVRPSLAVSQGRLILLSTPYGKQGMFWQAWNQPDWSKVKVTADQGRASQRNIWTKSGAHWGACGFPRSTVANSCRMKAASSKKNGHSTGV